MGLIYWPLNKYVFRLVKKPNRDAPLAVCICCASLGLWGLNGPYYCQTHQRTALILRFWLGHSDLAFLLTFYAGASGLLDSYATWPH